MKVPPQTTQPTSSEFTVSRFPRSVDPQLPQPFASGFARRDFLRTLVTGSLVTAGAGIVTLGSAAPKLKDAHPVDPPSGFAFTSWTFEKTTMYGSKNHAVVALPTDLKAGELLPLVVMLPGGEHTMQRRERGCWAVWSDFRLGDVIESARSGKVDPTALHGCGGVLEAAALAKRLDATPYRRAAIVTPFVLRRQTQLGPHGAMNTPFLRTLVERARKELPVLQTRDATLLGGVSAGGAWVFHCGALLSDLFATLVAVQPYTDGYESHFHKLMAERKEPNQRIRIVSSRGDSLLKHNVRYIAEAKKRGITIEHEVYPGPHAPEFMQGPGGFDLICSWSESFAAMKPPASVELLNPTPSVSATPSVVSAPAPADVMANKVELPIRRVVDSAPVVPPPPPPTSGRWFLFSLIASGIGLVTWRITRHAAKPPAKAVASKKRSPEPEETG